MVAGGPRRRRHVGDAPEAGGGGPQGGQGDDDDEEKEEVVVEVMVEEEEEGPVPRRGVGHREDCWADRRGWGSRARGTLCRCTVQRAAVLCRE